MTKGLERNLVEFAAFFFKYLFILFYLKFFDSSM